MKMKKKISIVQTKAIKEYDLEQKFLKKITDFRTGAFRKNVFKSIWY